MTHSVMTSKMSSLGNSVNPRYSRYSKAEKLFSKNFFWYYLTSYNY